MTTSSRPTCFKRSSRRSRLLAVGVFSILVFGSFLPPTTLAFSTSAQPPCSRHGAFRFCLWSSSTSEYLQDILTEYGWKDRLVTLPPHHMPVLAEIQHEFQHRGLPPHPLFEEGLLSIGCAPCTVPVKEGESFRSGRWAHTKQENHEQKTECGLHRPVEYEQ